MDAQLLVNGETSSVLFRPGVTISQRGTRPHLAGGALLRMKQVAFHRHLFGR